MLYLILQLIFIKLQSIQFWEKLEGLSRFFTRKVSGDPSAYGLGGIDSKLMAGVCTLVLWNVLKIKRKRVIN